MKKTSLGQLRTLDRDFWMLVDENEMPQIHPPDCMCEGVWEEIDRLGEFAVDSDASFNERGVSEQEDDQLSNAQLGTLIDAVEQDLGTVSDNARLNEERLAKVETQTRVLAEAVIAVRIVRCEIWPSLFCIC